MNTQAQQSAITFGQLFKFFRIQAGFTTIAQFADALADHNIVYCESLYYHWQRNNKIPTNRKLVLQVIAMLTNHGGIVIVDQANLFLETSGKGYLTKSELAQLSDLITNSTTEQISDFEKRFQQFIELENFKKIKPKEYKKSIPKVIRFNCMLEEGTNSFLNKVAKANNTTKSNFIRQLILEHQKNMTPNFTVDNQKN